MINNTLNQVNHNLARSIEKRYEENRFDGQARRRSKERKGIQIPKLEPLRPPPSISVSELLKNANFNNNLSEGNKRVLPGMSGLSGLDKEIKDEDFDEYKIKESLNSNDL